MTAVGVVVCCLLSAAVGALAVWRRREQWWATKRTEIAAQIRESQAEASALMDALHIGAIRAVELGRNEGYARGFADGLGRGAVLTLERMAAVPDTRVVVTDSATGRTVHVSPPLPRFSALIVAGRLTDESVAVYIESEHMPGDPAGG